MTKLIYLDSSDFSDLSATGLSAENAEILELLRSLKRDGKTKYGLSLVHLAEATHASEKHRQSAVRRATLMSEFGDIRLRFPNEIFGSEIARALATGSGALEIEDVVSSHSDWFGISLDRDIAAWRKKADDSLDDKIKYLPRRERRKFKSELNLNSKHGRKNWRTLIRQSPPPISKEFPLNLLDQEFVLGWLLREESDESFLRRLMNIMNDPRSMVEQVLDATDQRSIVHGVLRKQGEEINMSIKTYVTKLIEAISLLHEDDANRIAANFRSNLPKPDLFRALASKYSTTPLPDLDDKELVRVVESCPALRTFCRAFLNYAVDVFHANFQKLKKDSPTDFHGKPSDFGDLLHAAYAPYVDWFRCDGFFGAVLKKDPCIRLRILDKRHQLLSVLRGMSGRN